VINAVAAAAESAEFLGIVAGSGVDPNRRGVQGNPPILDNGTAGAVTVPETANFR
jgi:hypothetical protein